MRASADVIIPFSGSRKTFARLLAQISALQLGAGDSLTIVDNTRSGVARSFEAPPGMTIVSAPGRQSSYYARNCGAVTGRDPWLVFLDADVRPVPDLVDRYLEPAPDPTSAVLCGSIRDVAASATGSESLASRYARLRRLIDQINTLQMSRPYAKTANCAIRRIAFEQVGGFADNIRSGGDADLCFRLREAGWGMELRPGAAGEHAGRRRLVTLLGQRARHGSGAEWLEARYPGFVGPRGGLLSLARIVAVGAAGAAVSIVLRRDGDEALVRVLEPVSNVAFDVGRRMPNTPWREQVRALCRQRPSRWRVGAGEVQR